MTLLQPQIIACAEKGEQVMSNYKVFEEIICSRFPAVSEHVKRHLALSIKELLV